MSSDRSGNGMNGKPTLDSEPDTPTETSPLLPNGSTAAAASSSPAAEKTWPRYVTYLVLFTAFLVSVSFGITQVSLIYVFHVMTCDEYYKTHPIPDNPLDKCRIPIIEAEAAASVAILGASTTIFGVLNLFVTSWVIKRSGIKSALVQSVAWPAVRLATQAVGVRTGSAMGILIIQLSQIITVIGGPMGYMLALNSLAAEVVPAKERTATLGRLQGCMFSGSAVGFLVGGLIAEPFGVITPFYVAFVMFVICTAYVYLTLPKVPTKLSPEQEKKMKSIRAFFEPLLMFRPQKWVLKDGTVQKQYGIIFLGLGSFLTVLATNYIQTLLQLYANDFFDFNTTEIGWLISSHMATRGVFLVLIFPNIIALGRRWADRRQQQASDRVRATESGIAAIPTDPAILDPPSADGRAEEPAAPPAPAKGQPESFRFDLEFTRWSALLDGCLTMTATFVTEGWQLYLVGVILPFASGTGAASKGSILQMCSPAERTDALSAITLVESLARLSTTGLFGVLYAAFAVIGRPNLTFLCNAALALLASFVLYFARFPPSGATRLLEEETEASE